MAEGLLDVGRQGRRVADHRHVRVDMTGQNLPAVGGPLVNAARVDVPGDDVGGRVRPVFGVLGGHEVHGPPVVGVEELLAAQLVAEVGHHFGIEAAHGAGEELHLIGGTGQKAGPGGRPRRGAAAEVPNVQHPGQPVGPVVAAEHLRARVVLPGGAGLLQRAVLLDEKVGILAEQQLLGIAPEPHDSPPQQAVFVLQLDDGHGRLVGQLHARVGVRAGTQGFHPCLVAGLKLGVEVDEVLATIAPGAVTSQFFSRHVATGQYPSTTV